MSQQRGKSRTSTAMWKKKTQHSNVKMRHGTCVKKVDIAQQCEKVDRVQLGGNSRHSAAAWKKGETWGSSVERVDIRQQRGKN